MQHDSEPRLWAARVFHFVNVKDESAGKQGVAICDLYQLTEKTEAGGSWQGHHYEAQCAEGACEPVLRLEYAQYPVLLSGLQRKLVWFDGTAGGEVGNKWLFIPHPNNKAHGAFPGPGCEP